MFYFVNLHKRGFSLMKFIIITAIFFLNKLILAQNIKAKDYIDSFNNKKNCYLVSTSVHFNPIIRENLNRIGSPIQILEYIHPNNYLAIIDVSKLLQIDSSYIEMLSISPIPVEKKLSKQLQKLNYLETIPVWVKYCPCYTKEEILKVFYDIGIGLNLNEIHVEHSIVSCKISKIQIEKIIHHPAILYIESIPTEWESENNQSNQMLGSTWIKATNHSQVNGKGINIMLNDEGEIGNHIDWKNRIDESEANPLPDFANHPQHIAGTLIGAGNRDPRYEGFAPGASLKVYTYTTDISSGKGFFAYPNAYYQDSIFITSTSQSDGCNQGYTWLSQLMDQQIHSLSSLMHVFSAGNSGNNNCAYGASNGWGTITGGHKQAKNVISVGNITNTDILVASSSRGPASDGRIKPECVALGTNVYSTTNYPDLNSYTFKSGTSHACPAIAGSLALLYELFFNQYTFYPSSALIKAILLNTCNDLGNKGPDFKFGFGKPNLRKASEIIKQNYFFQDSIIHNQVWDTTIQIPSNVCELRVMLYWNDAPASLLSSKYLVNDLDIELQSPDSTIFFPWVLNPYPHPDSLNALAVRKIDTLNNIEQITVTNPTAGNWKIRVKGSFIPMGPQSFVVVYDWLHPELTITYPNGNEQLVPNETITIRWDAFVNTSSDFQLYYSSDSGNNWLLIQSNIPSTQKYFDWLVPNDISGGYLIKIDNGFLADTSDFTFSVMYTADSLQIDTICDNMILLNWPDVPQAAGYIIYKLGENYMDSITFTIQSQEWIPIQGPLEDNWFSVSVLGPHNSISRRAYAISAQTYFTNCNSSSINIDFNREPVLFPNPAETKLYLSFQSQEIPQEIILLVYDVSGKKIIYQKQKLTQPTIHIDISTLSKGVYLLTILHNNGLNTWRFIKQ